MHLQFLQGIIGFDDDEEEEEELGEDDEEEGEEEEEEVCRPPPADAARVSAPGSQRHPTRLTPLRPPPPWRPGCSRS